MTILHPPVLVLKVQVRSTKIFSEVHLQSHPNPMFGPGGTSIDSPSPSHFLIGIGVGVTDSLFSHLFPSFDFIDLFSKV